MQTLTGVKQRIEAIKYQIDCLGYQFFSEDNKEDFEQEKDSACISLDDALEIIERDIAYRDVQPLLPV